jgi:hypothetical protein
MKIRIEQTGGCPRLVVEDGNTTVGELLVSGEERARVAGDLLCAFLQVLPSYDDAARRILDHATLSAYVRKYVDRVG